MVLTVRQYCFTFLSYLYIKPMFLSEDH